MRRLMSGILFLLIIVLSSINVPSFAAGNVQIVSNGNTTFLIESDGEVKGWGRNDKGELGIGTTEDEYSPVVINGLNNISEIIPADASHEYFFAIDHDGYAYSWGYNGYGQLGLGNTDYQLTPARIDLQNVREIIIQDLTVYVLTSNGDVYAWGKNNYGQVGNASKATQTIPYKIIGLSNVKEIICGGQTVFALTEDRRVYAWGRADDFQMGNGTAVTAQTTPFQISDLNNVDKVITNGITSFAICDNYQEVYSWGEGWHGELGTYSERNRRPTRIWALSDLNEAIDELIIKQCTCFAITSNGTLYGWGDNSTCQLGNGGLFDKGIPAVISNIPQVDDFIFNGYTGIVLGKDGSVYSWGKNSSGEAGTGSTGRIPTPQKINALGNNITEIYNGDNSMYAVNEDGDLYAWGCNTSGQLGIGIIRAVNAPTIIDGISDISSTEKKEDTVFAMDTQGIIYGWGENGYGQVGDDSVIDVLSPYTIFNSVLRTVTGTGDVLSAVPVVGSINALEISITHPLNISYSINPNIEESFVCPDIEIQNNSMVPVKIVIESFKTNPEGSIVFEDTMPDSFNWDTLNRQETKKYIALGLDYVDESQWLIVLSNMPLYSAEIDNDFIGALSSGSMGNLKLYCSHGLAFDESYSSMHELIFIVSLL